MPQIPPVDQLKDIATGGDYTLSGVLLVFACFVCYMIFRIIGWSGTKVNDIGVWIAGRADEAMKRFYSHLDAVDETMGSLNNSLNGINSRLDNLDGKMDHLNDRVDHIDRQLNTKQ